jgi:hypothetical protein
MTLLLLPLMGALHLRYPRYNAETLVGLLDAFRPDALALTPLPGDALSDPAWQDTDEIALPLSVVPWALRRGVPVYGVLEPSPDASAQADFRRYAAEYPQLGQAWREAEAHLTPLADLLAEPLELPRVASEVLPLLRAHQEAREATFGDGPATDWLRARAEVMARRIRELPHARVAVLSSAEHLPFLTDALGEAEVPVDAPPPTEAERARSLLDVAFRGEAQDPGRLLAALREIDHPEARYHEANLLLAHDHPAEALAVLEAASQGDFSRPYFLPGFLLARLGQLYDLAGRRDAARRAYLGVLALAYAPAEAREAAQMGLEQPFAYPEGP